MCCLHQDFLASTEVRSGEQGLRAELHGLSHPGKGCSPTYATVSEVHVPTGVVAMVVVAIAAASTVTGLRL
jgi:hypothetical protein